MDSCRPAASSPEPSPLSVSASSSGPGVPSPGVGAGVGESAGVGAGESVGSGVGVLSEGAVRSAVAVGDATGSTASSAVAEVPTRRPSTRAVTDTDTPVARSGDQPPLPACRTFTVVRPYGPRPVPHHGVDMST